MSADISGCHFGGRKVVLASERECQPCLLTVLEMHREASHGKEALG